MFRPSSVGQDDYYGFCWLLPNIRKLLFSSPAPDFAQCGTTDLPG